MLITFKNSYKQRQSVDCKKLPLFEQYIMQIPEIKDWVEDMRAGRGNKSIITSISRIELRHIGKEIYDYYQTHYEDGKKRLNPYLEFGLLSLPRLISDGAEEYQMTIYVTDEQSNN